MPKHFPCIDKPAPPPNNGGVLFNSGTGFGDPTDKADSRHLRLFLRPLHTIGTSLSMAGHGGDTFGYAGFLIAGSPTLPCACHPRLATRGGFNPDKEAYHA